MRQRGVTLIELVVVVAIIVLIAMTFMFVSQGGRPGSTASAAVQFDAALDYAEALAASSGNGSTLVFATPSPLSPGGGSPLGFVLTVFSGRPDATNALKAAAMPPVESTGTVSEAVLGAAPFTIFLDSAGHASGKTGVVIIGSAPIADPGCPSGETSVVLKFTNPRASSTRTLPCSNPVDSASLAIATVAPEPSAAATASSPPPPTPCPSGYSGTAPNCVPASLPPPATPCPSGYSGTAPTCIPPSLPPLATPCPSGDSGTAPNCVSPTPSPTPAPTSAGLAITGNVSKQCTGAITITCSYYASVTVNGACTGSSDTSSTDTSEAGSGTVMGASPNLSGIFTIGSTSSTLSGSWSNVLTQVLSDLGGAGSGKTLTTSGCP